MSTVGDPMPGATPEYSPFHPELDSQYPISSIRLHPEIRIDAVNGQLGIMDWQAIFSNSPARNIEAELLMGRFVTDAIRAGQWVDVLEPMKDERVEPFVADTPEGKFVIDGLRFEHRRAVDILERIGFVKRVSDAEGRRFVQPTEHFMEYLNERIGFSKT